MSRTRKRVSAENTLAVARGRFDGAMLTEVVEILVADAWATSGNLSGRIAFGPDATSYVTVGDRSGDFGLWRRVL